MELGNVEYSIDVGFLNPGDTQPHIDQPSRTNDTRIALLGLVALVSTSTGHAFFGQPEYLNTHTMVRSVPAFSSHAELLPNFSAEDIVQDEHVDQSIRMVHTDYVASAVATYVPLTANIETTVGGELVVTEEDRKIINDMITASTADLNAGLRELAAEFRGFRELQKSEFTRLEQRLDDIKSELQNMKSDRKWMITTGIAIAAIIANIVTQIALHHS